MRYQNVGLTLIKKNKPVISALFTSLLLLELNTNYMCCIQRKQAPHLHTAMHRSAVREKKKKEKREKGRDCLYGNLHIQEKGSRERTGSFP